MKNNIVVRRRYDPSSESDVHSLVDMIPPRIDKISPEETILPPNTEYADIFMVLDSAYVSDIENSCDEFYVCCKDGVVRHCNRNKWIKLWEGIDPSPVSMIRRFSEYARVYTTLALTINACCRFAIGRLEEDTGEKKLLESCLKYSEDNVGVENLSKFRSSKLSDALSSLEYDYDFRVASATRAISNAIKISTGHFGHDTASYCMNEIISGSLASEINEDRRTLAGIIRSFIPLRKMLLVDALDSME